MVSLHCNRTQCEFSAARQTFDTCPVEGGVADVQRIRWYCSRTIVGGPCIYIIIYEQLADLILSAVAPTSRHEHQRAHESVEHDLMSQPCARGRNATPLRTEFRNFVSVGSGLGSRTYTYTCACRTRIAWTQVRCDRYAGFTQQFVRVRKGCVL